MPRIRKKPSRRQSTQDRRKIQHKVREGKKKKAKQAKKDPQWKSRHKKDPGIPNSFPYKEQILAEIAEQRRLEAEERQRLKEKKRALKAAQKKAEKSAEEVEEDGDGNEDAEGEDEDAEGDSDEEDAAVGRQEVASLRAKAI